MINHIWSVLCRESVIDSETNNVSLLNILERLEVIVAQQVKPNTPISIPITYELVSLWQKSGTEKKEQTDIEVTLIDPDKKVLRKLTKKIEISAKLKRLRSRLKISGVSVLKSGNYTFNVSIKRKNKAVVVASLPLEVQINK